ncbi:hypothetical protein BZL43_08660 [Pseudomonas sp. PICF141]|nr:hypothetical protein BZL43_08660 [Pseudomonas sp. PICF141]
MGDRYLFLIVPTLCVGTPQRTLCVCSWGAERPGLHTHAERGNDHLRVCRGAHAPRDTTTTH